MVRTRFTYTLIHSIVFGMTLLVASAALASPPKEDDARDSRSTSATSRRHTVRRPATVSLSGQLYDSLHDQPVPKATVKVQDRQTKSDSDGRFTFLDLDGGNATIVASRWGYETANFEIGLIPGENSAEIPMESLPEVVVTTTEGLARLDLDTTQFGYLQPFVGAILSSNLDVCTTDGTSSSLNKSEFARLDGPSVHEATSACCSGKVGERIHITLKSSEDFDAFLTSSCAPYIMYISGLEKATSKSALVPFTKVISVVFP